MCGKHSRGAKPPVGDCDAIELMVAARRRTGRGAGCVGGKLSEGDIVVEGEILVERRLVVGLELLLSQDRSQGLLVGFPDCVGERLEEVEHLQGLLRRPVRGDADGFHGGSRFRVREVGRGCAKW